MPLDPHTPLPLYRQLADLLRGHILSGSMKPGDRLEPHRELAVRHGVSLITVKRALTELIREGLLYSRPGKGTFVATARPVRAEVGGKTIGLVLSDLTSPFFSMVLHSIEEHAFRHGLSLLLSNSAIQQEREESQIRHFRSIGAGGLIIASMTHEYRATATIRELHSSGYPFVMVSYLSDPEIAFVGTDHVLGGEQAARHLLSLGYTTFGYINGETGNQVGDLRREGFFRALREHGCHCPPEWEFRLRRRGERFDEDSGFEIGREFARLASRPRAVFAYNDLAALGFEKGVLEAGLDIPGDVALVGFDGIERGAYAPVPLTTIRQPVEEIGAAAVTMLVRRMGGGSPPIRSIVPASLIVRGSCGAAVARDEAHRTYSKHQ